MIIQQSQVSVAATASQTRSRSEENTVQMTRSAQPTLEQALRAEGDTQSVAIIDTDMSAFDAIKANREQINRQLRDQAFASLTHQVAGQFALNGVSIRINNEPISIRSTPIGSSQPIMRIETNALRSEMIDHRLSVQALGQVTTEDGRSIDFALQLNLREQQTQTTALQQVELRQGDNRVMVNRIDPLVINLSNQSASLGDTLFEFDLNVDGQSEQLNFVSQGSGFLAFDKNQDGTINNGSELFGAMSGNGFAELAAYDSDLNAWIDESDPIFAQLAVWQKDAQGEDQLTSLKELGVGAIYLNAASGKFALIKDDQHKAEIAATSIYLHENGQVGSIQHMDYMLPNNDQVAAAEPNTSRTQLQTSQRSAALERMMANVSLNTSDQAVSVLDRSPEAAQFQGISQQTTQFEWQSLADYKWDKFTIGLELITKQFEAQQLAMSQVRQAKR